ncbi:unnamed protein product [Nyctereutes procyonoides]|uniref:(raccoon dog) hypothetical protein n=1 Tax=Nyctereutes procyonoides TaxID=34880 RepID=A0A811Y9J5_NYCPR|nr:unnamed protein product [Nyctereutes procyonoides]
MCLDSDPVICPVNRALLEMVSWKSHPRQELRPGLSIWPQAGYSHLHPQMMSTPPTPAAFCADSTGGGRRGETSRGGETGSGVRAHQAAPAPPSPDPAPEGVGRLGPQEPRPHAGPAPASCPRRAGAVPGPVSPASPIHRQPPPCTPGALAPAWSLLARPKLASPAGLSALRSRTAAAPRGGFPRFLLRARALAEELTLLGSSGNGDGDPRNREQKDVLKSLLPSSL